MAAGAVSQHSKQLVWAVKAAAVPSAIPGWMKRRRWSKWKRKTLALSRGRIAGSSRAGLHLMVVKMKRKRRGTAGVGLQLLLFLLLPLLLPWRGGEAGRGALQLFQIGRADEGVAR